MYCTVHLLQCGKGIETKHKHFLKFPELWQGGLHVSVGYQQSGRAQVFGNGTTLKQIHLMRSL